MQNISAIRGFGAGAADFDLYAEVGEKFEQIKIK